MAARTLPRWVIRFLAAPTYVYDWDAGWLLGRRFVRLTHEGRRSGRVYRTMLEVVGEDRAIGEVFVMAGLGRSAQWYRNVRAGHALEIAIGRERFRPLYREPGLSEAASVFAAYERRNRLIAPMVRLVLSRLVGWHYDGSAAGRQRLVAELPLVAFRPAT
jgi:deazaflavin-dependent oxidoreductase (nitroreductase family)